MSLGINTATHEGWGSCPAAIPDVDYSAVHQHNKMTKSKTNNVTGSATEIPQDLLQEIRNLEEIFTVPTEKLKAISEHFISELAKGLSVEGGSIVS